MEKNEDEFNDNKTHGFILENKNIYITRNNRIIFVKDFKKLCKRHGIVDWLKELKKL